MRRHRTLVTQKLDFEIKMFVTANRNNWNDRKVVNLFQFAESGFIFWMSPFQRFYKSHSKSGILECHHDGVSKRAEHTISRDPNNRPRRHGGDVRKQKPHNPDKKYADCCHSRYDKCDGWHDNERSNIRVIARRAGRHGVRVIWFISVRRIIPDWWHDDQGGVGEDERRAGGQRRGRRERGARCQLKVLRV